MDYEYIDEYIDLKLMGERIKQARLKKHMSQVELAYQLDVSTAFVSKLEKGKTPPNLKRINQLCQILDVPQDFLLTGIASQSTVYLYKEFQKLLEGCSPETQRLIYDVAVVIADKEKKDKED